MASSFVAPGSSSIPTFGVGGSDADPSDPDAALLSANYGSIFGFSANESTLPVQVRTQQRPQGMENVMGPVKTVQGQKASTFQEVMKSYAEQLATDPDGFKNTQAKLYGSGFYDKYLGKGETPKFGRMDADTVKALHDAIGEAVVTGATVDDIMESANASGKLQQGKSKQNPEIVKASAQSVAQSTIGKQLDPNTLSEIVNRADALNTSTYTDANGNVGDNSGSADEAWLQQQIRSLLPQTTQAYGTAQNVGSLLKLLDTQGQFSAYHQ